MDRRDIQKHIERYERLLEAASDDTERRAILKLLQQERAKLKSKDQNPNESD